MPTIQTTRVFFEIQHAVDAGYTVVSEQGGARSGKTTNTVIWLINYCLSHPKTRLAVVRATFPALKGSVMVDFKDQLLAYGVWSDKAFNKNDSIFNFSNGSWIEFFSCDSEQKLRGRKRDILYVNEANEISPLEWRQLRMRTTRFSVVDYNPSFSDEHWLCELNKDKRTYHFVTTYLDNPFLEQTIIDEIESYKTTNQSLWRIYGLGQQAMVEGLIFSDVEVVDEIPSYVKKRWRGMDFGFTNDPTAIVDVGLYQNDLYVDELCYRTEMVTSDIVKVLKDNGPLVETISESADPRLVQEIYRAGVNIHPVQKYPGSIDAGINKMQEYHIKVTKRSYNVLKEFRNHTWAQDKEGHWINKPIDMWNHGIDAIRYVVMMKILGGRAKPVNMARLANIAH